MRVDGSFGSLTRRRCLIGGAALLGAGFAGWPVLASADCSADVDADVLLLTRAYNATGRSLFQSVAAKPGAIVMSPYSLGGAMAMALSGARGATEVEIAGALSLSLPRARMEAANRQALALLRDRPDPACATAGLAAARVVKIANALVLAQASADLISGDYVALIRHAYGADFFLGASIDTINAWVRAKTDGKIPVLLSAPPPAGSVALLSAIAFKGAWLQPFAEAATSDGDFFLADGAVVRTPMMRLQARFAWTAGDGFRAIQLPFADASLGLVIVSPDAADGLDAVAAKLDAEAQSRLFDALNAGDGYVELSLPKFRARFAADFLEPFRALGLKVALSSRADFGGMTGGRDPGWRIGQILHRAFIEIDERGAEAAAASAVVMPAGARAPDAPAEVFSVDRAFLFYVVEATTGAILFEGRIVDPTRES
jgi:serpin B